MGEKAQESTAARAGLPTALVVAGGALLGGAVAVPTVLLATSGGDEPEAAVTAEATTTTLAEPTTTTIVVTSTNAPVATPPLPATLTPTASTNTAGQASFPLGVPIAGSSVTCTGDRCTVEVVAGRVRVAVEIVLVDDRGSADYTFTIPEAECPGTGVDRIHGTVELERVGAGFAGIVTLDTDVYQQVEGPNGNCAGSTNTFALTAPA